MKIVFFGTPDYVLPVLEALYRAYGVGENGLQAVVTQPPKEVGRKKFIERSAVDNWAYKHRILVLHDFDNIPEANLGIVAAYGKIIPENVIKKFGSGMLNVHPSLLPAFRGASPIQAAIATDTNPTGVTIIKMDAEMDHGPIVSSFKEHIEQNDTTESLRKRCFERSAKFLIDLMPSYLASKINLKPQDHAQATFTKTVKKDDGFIDPSIVEDAMEGKITKDWKISFIKDLTIDATPQAIERFIRAMQPWPQAWTKVEINGEKKRLKILKSHIEDASLVMDEVQLEGKTEVSWNQFKEGYPSFKLA